jgi:hypothetical protein
MIRMGSRRQVHVANIGISNKVGRQAIFDEATHDCIEFTRRVTKIEIGHVGIGISVGIHGT